MLTSASWKKRSSSMPERSSSPCFRTGSMPGRKPESLPLLHELLARPTQLRSDAFLDGDERAELAGQPHLAHHLPEEIAQKRRIEPRGKLLDERRVARHRLGDDDVRATYARTLGCRNTEVLPRPLRAQPERERSDLRARGSMSTP